MRRLLDLRAGGGLQLHQKAHALLTGLPQIDWAAVHALGDEISSNAAAPRFETYFELLFGLIARAVRAGASGEGRAEDVKLAAKLMGRVGPDDATAAKLASWAALWETMHAKKAQTLALNLDRKALVLETAIEMEQLARLTNN